MTTPRRHPKRPSPIVARASPELIRRIDAEAARRHQPRQGWILVAIEEKLARDEGKG